MGTYRVPFLRAYTMLSSYWLNCYIYKILKYAKKGRNIMKNKVIYNI